MPTPTTHSTTRGPHTTVTRTTHATRTNTTNRSTRSPTGEDLRAMSYDEGTAALRAQPAPNFERGSTVVTQAQLPLRPKPDARATTSVYVPRGASVEVQATEDVGGVKWVQIRYALDQAQSLTGWVLASKLSPQGHLPKSTQRDKYEKAKVNETGVVNRKQLEAEAAKIAKYKDRYMVVAQKTGLPWWVIGFIHLRESGLNFNTYLHNGDPLGKKTVHVPKGILFYKWEDAAVHALTTHRAGFEKGILEGIERYNGLGYRKKGVASPYVWSGTDQYKSGKYVADGKFSSRAVDRQSGAAGIFKVMEEKGLAQIDEGML